MKKYYWFVLLFLFRPLDSHASFSDVPVDHEYHEAISTLEGLDVIQGYEDGRFGVDELVNRGEFLKMVLLAESHNPDPLPYREIFPFDDLDSVSISPPCFLDFDGAQWYEPYVCWSKAHDLIQGYPSGEFRAIDPVNFAEATKILVEVAYDYSKDSSHHWAQGYIEAHFSRGEIPPSIENLNQSLTRGEVAELILRTTLADSNDLIQKPGAHFRWVDGELIISDYLGIAYGTTIYIKTNGNIYAEGWHEDGFSKVEGVDIASFKIYYLGNVGVATDNDHVIGIEGSAGGPFEFIREFDGETFNNAFGKDDAHIYRIQCYEGCRIDILEGSDLDSFKFLDYGFSEDKNHIYLYDWALDLNQIDKESFEILSPYFVKDKHGYYHLFKNKGAGGELIPLDEVDTINSAGHEYHYLKRKDPLNFEDKPPYYPTNFYYFDATESPLQLLGLAADIDSFRNYEDVVEYEDSKGNLIQREVEFLGDWYHLFHRGGQVVSGSVGGLFEIIEGSFFIPIEPEYYEFVYDFEDDFSSYQLDYFGSFSDQLEDPNIFYGYARDSLHAYLVILQPTLESLIWLPHSDANSFKIIGEGYTKDSNQVYFRDDVVEGADPDTFERLSGPLPAQAICPFPFSRDAENLFLEENLLEDLDLDTLEFLQIDGLFLKDKDSLYRTAKDGKGPLCSPTEIVAVPEADLDSFELLSPNYFMSEGRVYYINDWSEAEVTDIDLSSFKSYVNLNEPNPELRLEMGSYARDGNYVYYAGDRLVGVEVGTFEYDPIKGLWKDKNGTYDWSAIHSMIEDD